MNFKLLSCIICEKDMEPSKYGLKLYCSKKCSLKVLSYKRTFIWYQNNKEACNKRRKEWRRNNPDKVYAQTRRQRDKNPGIVSMYSRKRKERLKGSFTDKEWNLLCEKFGNVCLCCGKSGKLTVDHIIPVAAGGEHTIDNIQPLCLSCNCRKSDRVIIDYRLPWKILPQFKQLVKI